MEVPRPISLAILISQIDRPSMQISNPPRGEPEGCRFEPCRGHHTLRAGRDGTQAKPCGLSTAEVGQTRPDQEAEHESVAQGPASGGVAALVRLASRKGQGQPCLATMDRATPLLRDH